MDLRTRLCLTISQRLARPAMTRTVAYDAYQRWRATALEDEWRLFSDAHVTGRSLLDFGCGDGQLSLFLGTTRSPERIVGVDLIPASIERARIQAEHASLNCPVSFRVGSAARIPVDDQSVDTVLAFDCLEHVMEPLAILREWYRVIRPGGVCLLTWCPFKGPWGAHMESLIPVPWAPLLFGEKAVFQTAASLYDMPSFESRHWDLEPDGQKKPNKWRRWSSFAEQHYLNELDFRTLRGLTDEVGFRIDRLEGQPWAGSTLRRQAGRILMGLPMVGEYFVSKALVELRKPAHA